MSRDRPILVTGATGAQGGAVIDALLDVGIAVRALVRNPSSAAAQVLSRRGAEVVGGDFDYPDSLAQATAGAAGVFSVQLPPTPGDPRREMRTGQQLIDAALAAGVECFVHTSVARAGDHADFVGWSEGRWWRDYWTAKAAVNVAVRAAGFAHWVILKPAFMMDNFIPPKVASMFPALANGVLETAMTPDTRLDLIAARDIGRFAAAAFDDPQRFDTRELDLAAESLTLSDISAAIGDVTGKAVTARFLSARDAVAAGNHAGVVESQLWANVEGYRVDVAATRSYGIALESFAEWALRQRSAFGPALL